MSNLNEKIEEETVVLPKDEPEVVEVVDLGEADDTVVEKVAEKEVEKPKIDAPDERETALNDLRKQVEQQKAISARERQQREQIEQFAREQAAKVQSAEVEVQDSNLRMIMNALDATEQTAQGAERTYADAMAAGDYAAAAKAQRAMAQAESQLLQLNNGKRALEDRLQVRKTEGRVSEERPEIRPQAPSRTPIEEMAANLTPKSAEWLRSHPDAASSVAKLTAAHSAAVELEGIAVESPEYFDYIEQKLGMASEKPAKPEAKPSKPSIASVPVSSSGGGVRGGDERSMTLSPEEVERAIYDEPDVPRTKALEIYARNKRALQKEGRLK